MLLIERLDVSRHNRVEFNCGAESLNSFLRQYPRQFNERNIGVIWVAVADDDTTRVFGYILLLQVLLSRTNSLQNVSHFRKY